MMQCLRLPRFAGEFLVKTPWYQNRLFQEVFPYFPSSVGAAPPCPPRILHLHPEVARVSSCWPLRAARRGELLSCLPRPGTVPGSSSWNNCLLNRNFILSSLNSLRIIRVYSFLLLLTPHCHYLAMVRWKKRRGWREGAGRRAVLRRAL